MMPTDGMGFWDRLRYEWQRQNEAKLDVYSDRNAELERMRKDGIKERNSSIVYRVECLKCNTATIVPNEELKGYIHGITTCPGCGNTESFWIQAVESTQSGKLGDRVTPAVIDRDMQRFYKELDVWMASSEGQFAQYEAERSRRSA